MKMVRALIYSCCLLLATPPLLAHAQKTKIGSQDVAESPSDFVKQFYAWYVPRLLTDNSIPAYELALKHKKDIFTPILFNALRDDFAASAKVSDEIVGLDFDPFLNTQDPCKRYEVGNTIQKGDSYWIEVYGICSGKRSKKPDVWPEVVRTNGRWQFANFHYEHEAKAYPDSDDLMGILKLLREDREKSRK